MKKLDITISMIWILLIVSIILSGIIYLFIVMNEAIAMQEYCEQYGMQPSLTNKYNCVEKTCSINKINGEECTYKEYTIPKPQNKEVRS